MSVNMITKRALSTSVTLGQVIRPPIPVYGVEGRYAASLYSAAHKKNSLDAADKDLKLIKDLYNTHSDFKVLVYYHTWWGALKRLKIWLSAYISRKGKLVSARLFLGRPRRSLVIKHNSCFNTQRLKPFENDSYETN